jgi:hypothetical protein
LGEIPDWLQTEEDEVPAAKVPALKEGDRNIAFGRYTQGSKGENEPLHWRVLTIDEKGKRALLITDKVIDSRSYHGTYKSVTWAECDLRKWLNEKFLETAFTEAERKRIAPAENENPANKAYGTAGGRSTKEKVFLLSIDEAERFFRSDGDRAAEATDFAGKQGVLTRDDRMGWWWWLRSPGGSRHRAACVRPGGDIYDYGCYVYTDYVGVRPALWLNL